MNRLSLLTFVVSFACSSVSWSAPATEAEQFLKQAVDEVLAVSDRASNPSALVDKVRPILQRYISFETMARRAVGPGWRQFAPDQQKKATQLFTTLVIRTYSSKFTPGERPVMSYQAAVTPAAGRVDVPTKLVYQGSRYSVTYRLEQEGSWKITDVVIEGVSLIANYRTQLDAKFKAGGAPAVITSLEQSVSRPK
jgi:phospholipid transport system substrate-binding protein